MWVLKLETTGENAFFAGLAKKFGVSFSGYPISYRKEKDRVLVQVVGSLSSQTKAKKMLTFLKKESKFAKLELHENFVIGLVNMPGWLSVLYNPEVIFIKPAEYNESGVEYLELASWTKEPLSKVAKAYAKYFDTKIIKFSRNHIENVSLRGIHPTLTEKQKIAMELAVKHGYYAFPKKITLKKLAEIMGVSFSTFQAHLSKAEASFIPHTFQQILK